MAKSNEGANNDNGKSRSCTNNFGNLLRFSGNKDENVNDFLRQFRIFLSTSGDFDEYNLQHLASTYLIGDAGEFYDELYPEPKCWDDFKRVMIERYGKKKMDRAAITKNFLTKKQKEGENLQTYAEDMYKLGKSAKIDEELLVQTILMNMNPSESKMYRLHLNEDVTYEKLIRTINNVEINIPITKKNNETKKINENSELDLLIDKIDKMALIIEKTKNNDRTKIVPYCKKCMKKGHTDYDCRNTYK
ncbi:hypothetical protein COBT_003807 [Conglomerata obtusa]